MSSAYFVGEIVKFQNLQGVVLECSFESGGWRDPLLVYCPLFDKPIVIESREVEKIEFKDASDECQLISKTLLFSKDSKKYLRR